MYSAAVSRVLLDAAAAVPVPNPNRLHRSTLDFDDGGHFAEAVDDAGRWHTLVGRLCDIAGRNVKAVRPAAFMIDDAEQLYWLPTVTLAGVNA